MPIFHIAEPDDWNARTDHYRAPSLDTDGFIHCSTDDQLGGVARHLFAGRDDLLLLTIDPDGLEVVYEDLYSLGEEFPHLYGALPLTAVEDVRAFRVP